MCGYGLKSIFMVSGIYCVHFVLSCCTSDIKMVVCGQCAASRNSFC